MFLESLNIWKKAKVQIDGTLYANEIKGSGELIITKTGIVIMSNSARYEIKKTVLKAIKDVTECSKRNV